jgi:riboflavin biosynthesis pyrimidine reductase
MNDAPIRRGWPLRDAAVLDDAQLDECYAISDRSKQSLRVNFVSSIDGAATDHGRSGGLSGDADKRVFDLLRRQSDVILVGAGTVRVEGYGGMRLDPASVRSRRAIGLPEQPVFAIVSGTLGLDPESAVFINAPVRPIVVTLGAALRGKKEAFSRVADVLVCGEEALDVSLMLAAFAKRGLRHVLCEGGPTLFGTLLDADRVDELCLTVSPLIEGGEAHRIVAGAPEKARSMTLGHVLVSGGTLMLRYLRAVETVDSATLKHGHVKDR